jgi:hypothetical protein
MDIIFKQIPLELFEHCIVPYCPISWLFVSKKWHDVAIHNVVNEPYIISKASVILKNTILARNYSLASILVTDRRYTLPTALSLAAGAAYEDKISNKILLRIEGVHIARIFQRAVKMNWNDIVDHIITKNMLPSINLSSDLYRKISVETLQLFIEDPKLHRFDEFIFKEATANPNPKVPELCLKAKNLDLAPIVHLYGHKEHLLLEIFKIPSLYEPKNIHTLWEAISNCGDVKLEFVKEILTKHNLDPSAQSNYGLRRVIENSSARTIVKSILDDERVHITLEPYDMNPLFVAIVNTKREAIPVLLEHPKIKPEWIDIFLKHLIETEESAYGLELISRKLKHLVRNKELLEQIPRAIENIKDHVDEYTYFYAPDYWSDEEDEDDEVVASDK